MGDMKAQVVVAKFEITTQYVARIYLDLWGMRYGNIKHLRFKLPPLELQKSFAAFVHDIDKPKFKIQQSIDQLQLLFDSLMQKYFG